MTISENTIKSAKGSTKKRKRIGRGNASGTGTYAGKGLKGQKSRAGVSGLKKLGLKQVILRIPKKRGFKSLKADNQVVNLSDLNMNFKDGDKITPRILMERGLVETFTGTVKILGQGELKLKNLSFSKVKFSASAREQIEKNNGKIE